MVEALSQDLMYLLSGKDVSVQLQLSDCELTLAKTASEIVMGNVIRNTYQHTQRKSHNKSFRYNAHRAQRRGRP